MIRPSVLQGLLRLNCETMRDSMLAAATGGTLAGEAA
jgi:hypothetical protein